MSGDAERSDRTEPDLVRWLVVPATNARAWGDGRIGTVMAAAVAARGDIAVWIGWWVVIAGMLAVGLA